MEYLNTAYEWIQAIAPIFLASKGITVLTPTKVDNKWLGYILGFLNTVTSLNIGKDKNANS